MKETVITRARAQVWRAKLYFPFRTALGQHDILENVLFGIELKNGVRGFGEAGVASHITGESVKQTLARLRDCALAVRGNDLGDFPGWMGTLSQDLADKNPCALAALETAVLDALTRHLRIPLWRYFGEIPHPVSTDMTVVLGSVSEAAGQAREFAARRVRAVKIKIGGNYEEDLKRVFEVVRLLPKAAVYLDANQGYRVREILKFLRELKIRRIFPSLIEQPVAKDDWDGLGEVRAKSGVPVFADESVSRFRDALRFIRRRTADGINIKLMKFGIFRSREIVRMARASRIGLMIGQMMETPLAAMAAVHFAAGMGGFDFADIDTPFFLRGRVTRGTYWGADGTYDISPVKAGVGVRPL